MSLTAFSQTDTIKYPKTIIIGQDTITQFYTWQAREIAKDLILGDSYHTLFNIAEKQYYICLDKVDNRDSTIAVKNDQIDLLNKSILYKDSITIENNNIINSQASIITKLNKKDKTKKIRNWILTVSAIVATEELFRNIYKTR